jgi:hypothetical protein
VNGQNPAVKKFLKKFFDEFRYRNYNGSMKQTSRSLNLSLACSLVLGVFAGQSALGSVADLGTSSGSGGSSVSLTTSPGSTTATTVQSTPGSVSSSFSGWGGWGGGGSGGNPWGGGGHLNPVPEANAGLVLAALFPLMLLLTPSRVRKMIAAFRSGDTGSVGA